LNKFLSIALILILLGTLASFTYVVANPPSVEKFTEFYILGTKGKASDYPTQVKVGQEASLILGIINQEQSVVSYRVEIKINGVTTAMQEPVVLKPGEKLEQVVTFTPDKAGDNQLVEFLLYKEGQTDVYKSLHLWVNVKE